MSITVRRLVAGGYVLSSRDGADGRRTGLTLARKGQTIKEHNTVLDQELLKVMIGSIPTERAARASESLMDNDRK